MDDQNAPTLLYKYMDIGGLKRLLNQRSIRLTQPGAFNDPFELLPELVAHKDTPDDSKATFSYDLAAPRRVPSVGEVNELPIDHVSSDFMSRLIVRGLDKQIGVFCLSKEPNSILMWSHYADQYKGAVVAFDASHEFFAGQIDVEYLTHRPRRDLALYRASPVPIAELCAKSIHWGYEHEVRVVRLLSQCNEGIKGAGKFRVFTQKIPKECIRSITFGERTTVEHQRDIYALLKGTGIGLGLSAVDNRGYGFRQEIIRYPNAPNLGPIVSPRTAHIFSHLRTPLGEMARALIANHPSSKLVNELA